MSTKLSKNKVIVDMPETYSIQLGCQKDMEDVTGSGKLDTSWLNCPPHEFFYPCDLHVIGDVVDGFEEDPKNSLSLKQWQKMIGIIS